MGGTAVRETGYSTIRFLTGAALVAVSCLIFASSGFARGGVSGVAVLACVPGERHDLGLLMLAVMRAALAGAAAATVWGVLEPLDARLFRCDYSDIALLGKAVTRDRA